MSRRGVSGWMFLLVPAHPGSPGQRAVKQSCVFCTSSVSTADHTNNFCETWNQWFKSLVGHKNHPFGQLYLLCANAAVSDVTRGSHSNLRRKIQDFFRTRDIKTSAPIFISFRASTYELIAKQDAAKTICNAIFLCT